MADGISVSEWLGELARLGRKSAVGFTTEEAAASSGRGLTWTRHQMRKAFRAGLLEMAGTRESVRMDGKPCWVPVYRITKGVGVVKKSRTSFDNNQKGGRK